MKLLSIASLLLIVASAEVDAETLYRCGNEYTQSACPQGRAIDVPPPPTPAQQAEARRVAADEKQLAAEMERDRRVREAAIRPAIATSMSAPSRAASSAAAVRHRVNHRRRVRVGYRDGDDDFVARVAGTGRRSR